MVDTTAPSQGHKHYLSIALSMTVHSPCTKRKFGAALYTPSGCIFLGINGYYRAGVDAPHECNPCIRVGVPSGSRLELCRGLHAEQVAIMRAALHSMPTMGSTMYVAGLNPDGSVFLLDRPWFYCTLCARMMAAAGIGRVVMPVRCAVKGAGWEVGLLDMDGVWESAYATATMGGVPPVVDR